jgi:hypothetical protein
MFGGYGGFGYDTSHVRPDDPQPPIVKAAATGNLDDIQRLLREGDAQEQPDDFPDKCCFPGCKKENPTLVVCKKCKVTTYCGDYHKRKHRDEHKQVCGIVRPHDANKRCVLNASKRWTEVEYKDSGFAKDYEWHGLTALATAAKAGKPDIVEFLLHEGANPTLRGCPSEDQDYDALGAAKHSLKCKENDLAKYLDEASQSKPNYYHYYPTASDKRDPNEVARSLLQGKENLKRCIGLLEVASPFWKDHPNSHSRYTTKRHLLGFPENPSDLVALQEAIRTIPPVKPVSTQDIEHLVERIKTYRKRRKEEKDQAYRKRKREQQEANEKKKRRGSGKRNKKKNDNNVKARFSLDA